MAEPKSFEDLLQTGILRNGEYNTNTHDLIKDFYTPVLMATRTYDRTTGGFSSSGIRALALPLVCLIRNAVTRDSPKPVMRIVASHDISEQDYDDMLEGYRQKARTPEEELLELLKELKRRPDEELLKAVRNVGTMIKLGLLDIKVALPTNKLRGMYHRKIGIFSDFYGHIISFEGSQNISFSGDRSEVNLEGLVAFCSSDAIIENYKLNHQRFFENLWNNRLENVYVRPLEEYPRTLLATYGVPLERILEEFEREEKSSFSTARTYQNDAVQTWCNNGNTGIFDMCTGSGKTQVALMALGTIKERLLTVIVTGNLTDLIDQWADNHLVPMYGKDHVTILKASSVHGIRAKVERKLVETIQDFKLGFYATQDKQVFVLAAVQTASQEWFRSAIGHIPPSKLAIIIDEVHHAGAPGPTGDVLKINAGYRIGLSATWRRYDEDENGHLEQYFRGTRSAISYSYPLFKGIEDGVLSPYQYIIHPVSLDPDDAAELRQRLKMYEEELKRIDASLSLKLGDETIEKTPRGDWHRLLRLRDSWRNTLARAIAKTDLALQIVEKECGNLKKCIIYCSNKQHLDRTAILMGQRHWKLDPYDSHVPKNIRKRIRERFAAPYNGEPLFIGAIKCLDEGIDLPALDSAILVSSNRTEREWVQRRGRILRRYPGKEYSIIHDFIMLPYSTEAEAFTLTKPELCYIESELNRLEAFASDAINRGEAINLIKTLRSLFSIT